MFELTGFQRDLLFVIEGLGEPSGQEVRRKLENHVDNVNHGRLYPNLDVLVEHGFVEKGSQDQRTNFYTVTSDGYELIESRLGWERNQLSEEILVEQT